MSSNQRRAASHISYVRDFLRGLAHFEQPIRSITVSHSFAMALLREAKAEGMVDDPSVAGRFEINGVKIEVEN